MGENDDDSDTDNDDDVAKERRRLRSANGQGKQNGEKLGGLIVLLFATVAFLFRRLYLH